jgi:hypothetical protein
MLLGLLENLIEPAFKQLHVSGVGDRIKDGLVLPTRLEQPKGFKLGKLLRDGGNRDIQNLSKIADAKLLKFSQKEHDLEPGAVAHQVEKLGELIELRTEEHLVLPVLDFGGCGGRPNAFHLLLRICLNT